jgi:hypothetical protein
MQPNLTALVAASACAALLSTAAPAGAATTTSTNWAGYAVTGRTFRHVAGTWVVPAVDCASGSGDSAAWVGLGGYSSSSQALEQTGTEADCSAGGTARYSAWYELVPAAARTIRMTVRAGDHIGASVDVRGTLVTLSLRDTSTGATFTRAIRMTSPDTTAAEWVLEAPAACTTGGRCRQLALADFGSMAFSNATATTALGHTGTISDVGWRHRAINLTGGFDRGPRGGFGRVDTGGTATASALSPAGRSFTVDYVAAQS